jgi:hypothetical protein
MQNQATSTETPSSVLTSMVSPCSGSPEPAFQPMPAQWTWHQEITPNVTYEVIIDGQILKGFFDATRGLFYVGNRIRARLFPLSAISAFRSLA